jgi:O-antigen/teichoic acid export membrane protein
LLKRFLRDSAIYVIPTVLSRGLAVILVPLYTRVLSPADYGTLDMLVVFGSLVNLTVALEVSQGVARFYAGEQDPGRRVLYASSAFWFTVATYGAFAVAALAFSEPLSALLMGRTGLDFFFRLGVVGIWLNGIVYLIQNQFRWELRSTKYTVASLIVTCVTAAVAVFLGYVLRWGLTGLLLGTIAGSLAGSSYGLYHLRTSFRFRFHGGFLKEMLSYSTPLVPASIAVFVSHYIDRLMINHFLSLDAVGLYGIGFRLAGVVGLVMVGFQGALTPLVFTYYREERTPRDLADIFRLFIAFASMMFLGLTLFAPEILRLLTTPAYYAAAPVVVFLVPAILLSNMYLFAPGITIAKKTHLILWINVVGAALHFGFNLLLIPMFGIGGAAVATLGGYACMFAAYMVLGQRLYRVPHSWGRLGTAAGLMGLMSVVISAADVPSTYALTAKALALAGGVAIVLVTGLVRGSELRLVRDVLNRRLASIAS